MVEFEDKYVFKFHKLTKSWRKGRPPLCLPGKSKTLCSTSRKVISTGNTTMEE